ncbi:MAG: metallophosphoesterase family protein [Vicinamibacterales bacterium]
MSFRAKTSLIGLVSDTHGLLRPEAVAALAGVDLIVHAGDVGKPDVLDGLRAIAPVVAVRGNVDHGTWADELPEREIVRTSTLTLYVLHDLAELDGDPVAEGVGVVVSGHSHRPVIEWRGSVLYVNPGSIGPRRFSLPVSLALLRVDGPAPEARLVEVIAAPRRE